MTGPVDLAVVGNGRVAALLNNKARLVWWCFPRFDGDPVFSRLLAGDKRRAFATSCWTVRFRPLHAMSATPPSSPRC